MSSIPTPPRVVLCGPMGSGKSAVGRALARRWRVDLRDSDTEVESAAGMPISRIFAERGESTFREWERDTVTALLRRHAGVLALGGGAVLHPDSRAALTEYATQGGTVVFLDVSVEHAMRRVGGDRNRPLLAGADPAGRWSEILTERRPVYRQVATVELLTDDQSPAQVAAEIDRLLRS